MTQGEMEQDKEAEGVQISQSIEMTGNTTDVEKFALCEFRFYEVLPPETDTPSLALEETSHRNKKKRKRSALHGEFVTGERLPADGLKGTLCE